MGPAGIGKSRLAWELIKYVDGLVQNVYYHSGRSPAYGDGISFWALGEMVRARAGLLETDNEATTRAKVRETVAQWIADDAERSWVEPALLALLGIESGASSEELFSAWLALYGNARQSERLQRILALYHRRLRANLMHDLAKLMPRTDALRLAEGIGGAPSAEPICCTSNPCRTRR